MVLTQSPAEAYRLAALLLWFEADCKPMTAILPVSGEAVNLLPLAVQGRVADGEPRCGDAAIHEGVDVVQVALRQSDGRLRHDVQLLEAFHLEAERAVSQPVVYGTLGDGRARSRRCLVRRRRGLCWTRRRCGCGPNELGITCGEDGRW